jgi:hypothetical protein
MDKLPNPFLEVAAITETAKPVKVKKVKTKK